jgi:hypothetical protein
MRTRTTNGDEAFDSTGSGAVNLFFTIGSARKTGAKENVITEFKKVLNRDPDTAAAILCWARDCRGGAGERDTFRQLLNVLAKENPDVGRKVLSLIA